MPRAGDVAAQLRARAAEVAQYLLPAGKLEGVEWRNVGGEGGRSLAVNIRKGLWSDFGDTAAGGDMLDLWARVSCGGDRAQALAEASEWLGIDSRPKRAAKVTTTRQDGAPAATAALHALPGGRADDDPFPLAHPKRGRPAARYTYRHADGSPWAAVYRFERADGGKWFTQYTLAPKGWTGAGGELPEARPLYRLDEIEGRPDELVVIVEGEKAADAVAAAGYVATTTMGGANAAGKSDVMPLAGRRVVMWPDADTAGKRYADQVADMLGEIAAELRAVEVPAGAPKGWDAADATADQVRELIAAAAELPDQDAPERIGFTGARLLALLDRPPTPPVKPGIPVPGHFTLLVGASFAGKSTLARWLAMARAAGQPPWNGAPAFERGRVLFYSLDEAPEQVMRRISDLTAYHVGASDLEAIADNLVIIGPDRDVDPAKLDALRFDERGLAKCRRFLLQAQDAGAPFRELYVDAYADFLPPGEAENSNETGSRIGGGLERIAVETGTAVCVLHHKGKGTGQNGAEMDVRDTARGASSIVAKARTIFTIEEPKGMGRHVRSIRTRTNLSRGPKEALFQVCAPETTGTEVNYFQPYDPADEHKPADYLQPGESISQRELARRIGDLGPDENASPAVRGMANALRLRWEAQGVVEVSDGPKNSFQIKLKERQ